MIFMCPFNSSLCQRSPGFSGHTYTAILNAVANFKLFLKGYLYTLIPVVPTFSYPNATSFDPLGLVSCEISSGLCLTVHP